MAHHPWAPVFRPRKGVVFWCDTVLTAGPAAAMHAIALHRRDGSIRAWTLVDADGYDELSAFRWYLTAAGYAVRNPPQGSVPGPKRQVELLHRRILGLGRGDKAEADHINGFRLDNRRANLRVATHAQNAQNRSGPTVRSATGVRGVSFDRRRNRYAVQAYTGGRQFHGGRFKTLAEAEAAAIALRRELLPFSAADQPSEPEKKDSGSGAGGDGA
jgi:hypothetical protein